MVVTKAGCFPQRVQGGAVGLGFSITNRTPVRPIQQGNSFEQCIPLEMGIKRDLGLR